MKLIIMEPNQPTISNVTTTSIRKPIGFSFVFFLIGNLLFFLPFAEFKCKNATGVIDFGITKKINNTLDSLIAKPTGFNLAFGLKDYDETKTRQQDGWEYKFKSSGKNKSNGFALVALILGVLGFVISWLSFPSRPIVNAIIGALAAVALIGCMLDVKSTLKDQSGGVLTVEFTIWFYLSITSFVLASIFNYMGRNRS
jgi:hypothetical protein